jgi:ribonuclease G
MFGLLKKNRMKREIVINSENLEVRVAILENGRLEELEVEHPSEERIVGGIFKGRIQNLEHELQAAFVDIGLRRNAFLHYWDMAPDEDATLELEDDEQRRRTPQRKRYTNEEIEKRFPPRSEIVVQVTKGPIGTKGPRATASLSLPGRYLVLVPGTKLKGVSRKIEDGAERERLKKILARLPTPRNAGLIVRTVGAGASKRNFTKDLAGLVEMWVTIQKAAREKAAPCCLYQEPDLAERTVRDWLSEEVDRVVLDDRDEYERIRESAGRISRHSRSAIQFYEGELPIFEHYEVERQLEEALQRKVMLKSGGYIVFDEAEALIAVDVNTGRHKGKAGSQEEAILAVNTEAVEEVARQLRLRNVGGLVVLDLIDMKSRKNQSAVYRAFKAALKRDRARTNVLPISALGLLEMTRQRAEESLISTMYADCPYCRGRGHVKSPLSMSVEIQRQVSAIMRRRQRQDGAVNLQVVVHPTVLDRLRREDEQFLLDLETKFAGRLTFRSDPAKHVEYFSIVNERSNEVLFSSLER